MNLLPMSSCDVREPAASRSPPAIQQPDLGRGAGVIRMDEQQCMVTIMKPSEASVGEDAMLSILLQCMSVDFQGKSRCHRTLWNS